MRQTTFLFTGLLLGKLTQPSSWQPFNPIRTIEISLVIYSDVTKVEAETELYCVVRQEFGGA